MDPLEPGANHATEKAPRAARRSRRPLVAFGLIALPVAGSMLLGPAIADAAAPATEGAAASAGSGAVPVQDRAGAAAVRAFLDAGYTYDDAVVLSRSWGTPGPDEAKVKAGSFLADGTPLAATPLADPAADDGLGPLQLGACFFARGYTSEQAAELARQWGVPLADAKAKAGSELETVGVLPFVDLAPAPTSGDSTPTRQDEARFDAFFEAGYDYDDSVLLARHWGFGSEGFAEAKLKAGGLLLDDQPLPGVPGVAPNA
jgi:hypothetical protein